MYARLPRGQVSYAPELDWGFACQWWGADWAAWEALEAEEAAWRIAVYRAKGMIEAVTQWDAAKERERQAQRAKARAQSRGRRA